MPVGAWTKLATKEVLTRSYWHASALAALSLVLPVAALGAAYPKKIVLPKGYSPEGIAIRGNTFYISVPRGPFTGAIYRGNLRTGKGSKLVAPQADRIAGGIKIDQRNRLFVAGANTGRAFVYDGRTGAEIAVYQLAASGPTFVNDVVVTSTGAWFTDSNRPVLYRIPIGPGGQLGAAQTVPLTGDFDFDEPTTITPPPGRTPPPGATATRANGIDATPDGKTLVFVKSNTGKLFTVDGTTGVTHEIKVAGGPLSFADGLLLDGKTLHVALSLPNQVAVIRLAPDLSSGTIVATLKDPGLDTPTTIAQRGGWLYLTNARLTTTATARTPYWVIKLRKPRGS
jgi:sugar lactone lactonase YvrE